MPEPTATPTNDTTTSEKKQRCRAITTDGHRCRNNATYNGHLCWPHFHHRNPVLPDPTHVAIPLLEDAASVQLVLSQITHGLLTNKLDPERARALIYGCQVAAATLPRPPRLPSPHQPGAPSLSRPPLGATGWETDTTTATDSAHADSLRPVACGPWPDEEDLVHHLALDDQGIICGDGEFPLPNLHWQPAAPEATPWDLLYAAPNQSKPTPRSPSDPDTHCNCAICDEIRKKQAEPYLHPHLQPAVNPYCKRNQPGCQGPASYDRCAYCDGLYKYDPNKYNRRRRSFERSEETQPERGDRVPHPSRPAFSGERVGSPETWPDRSGLAESIVPDPQPLPNPLPEQFPDYDPILNGHRLPEADPNALDLKASTESRSVTCNLSPATCPSGNTQNLLPSNPFPSNKTRHTHPGGYPEVGMATHI